MQKTDLSDLVTSTLNNHRDKMVDMLTKNNAILNRFSHAGRMDLLAYKYNISLGNLFDLVDHVYGSSEMEEALQKLEGPHGETLLRAMLVRWKDRGHG